MGLTGLEKEEKPEDINFSPEIEFNFQNIWGNEKPKIEKDLDQNLKKIIKIKDQKKQSLSK